MPAEIIVLARDVAAIEVAPAETKLTIPTPDPCVVPTVLIVYSVLFTNDPALTLVAPTTVKSVVPNILIAYSLPGINVPAVAATDPIALKSVVLI